LRKVACGLQPSTTTARAGQATTGGIRGKVRSICGAKVGATDGNDGEHKKGGVDYDRRNLIRGGSVVGYRSVVLHRRVESASLIDEFLDIIIKIHKKEIPDT
jgi:hypothetical protein